MLSEERTGKFWGTFIIKTSLNHTSVCDDHFPEQLGVSAQMLRDLRTQPEAGSVPSSLTQFQLLEGSGSDPFLGRGHLTRLNF